MRVSPGDWQLLTRLGNKEVHLKSDSQVGKEMKALAGEVLDVVLSNSAGEMSRRQNWSFFVKNLPHDHNLMELCAECFDSMSKEQRRQFLARCARL